MATDTVTKIPEGMHTITPHLVCAGAADAIEFYKKAFNAVEMHRMPGPGGKLMHGAIRIGDSTVMLADEFPEWGSKGPKTLGGTPVTIHLYVEDVDAVLAQAVSAGATPAMPVSLTSHSPSSWMTASAPCTVSTGCSGCTSAKPAIRATFSFRRGLCFIVQLPSGKKPRSMP